MDPGTELAALYAELDAELAELQETCRACGRCCDFSTHGNILYASRLERDLLRSAGAPPGEAGPETCPYLAGGRCAARQVRALGCRTYFCDADAGPKGRELYERYRKRVAEISRRAGVEWDYRPVLDCLRETGNGPESLRASPGGE